MTAEIEERFEIILRNIKAYHTNVDENLIRNAFAFATKAHTGQMRKSGEPYIGHPVEVMGLTSNLQLGTHSLCAALLHDTVEDTYVEHTDILEHFGAEVSFLVKGLTKLSKMNFGSREEHQAENVRKLIIAMSKDIRVVLIKLADRLHNMTTLQHMPTQKQQRIARETLDIYTPLSNRLGINWLKIELEDYCLRYLDPDAYHDLARKLQETRKEREIYVNETIRILSEMLNQHSLKAEVHGRPKHIYSIYNKLKKKDVIFEDLYDLTAFRIIVHESSQCYEVLGLVHERWRPIAGRFKDYVAIPKPNGYQSVHTTVVGPQNKRIEIQIRDHEMNAIAEDGVAAHWVYKRGKKSIQKIDAFDWLKEMVQTYTQIDDPKMFLQSVKYELFSNEVFVFTPRGDIMSLPLDATPIDFAYAVHTEIGNQCTHAKVNGKMVSLKHILTNGDVVKIIVKTTQYPREEWLDTVKSSKARTKIRYFVQAEKRNQARNVAVELLKQEIRKRGLRYETLKRRGKIEAAAKELKFQTVPLMLEALGNSRVRLSAIIKILAPETTRTSPIRRFGTKLSSFINKKARSVRFPGFEGDLEATYARCCNPVPGDPIIGFTTRGRGLVVHAKNCSRLANLESERFMVIEWDQLPSQNQTGRSVTVRIVCRDEPGLLAKMSQGFSLRGVNITQAHCRATNNGLATNMFDLSVKNVRQLNEALKIVRKIDGVVSAHRVTS